VNLYKRNEDGSLGKLEVDTNCHVVAIETAIQFYKDLELDYQEPILAVIPKFDVALS